MTGFVLGDGLSKARSLSDQPASCPLCGAILRQSRNLRRHLELLHFGLGNGNKPSSVHPRHRRPDRANDFALSSALACARPTARIDSHLARASEASDFPMMTPLSITSSVSSASSVSLPGETRASRGFRERCFIREVSLGFARKTFVRQILPEKVYSKKRLFEEKFYSGKFVRKVLSLLISIQVDGDYF